MKSLVEVCQRLGQWIPTWTQGAGGNVSLKNEGELSIKATGFRLDQVNFESGLAKIVLSDFVQELETLSKSGKTDAQCEIHYADAISRHTLKEPNLGRPSMESGFHAVLSRKWVIHVHSLPTLLMAHLNERENEAFQSWLKSETEFEIRFLAPIRPGWLLTQEIIAFDTEPDAIVLANHGVILNLDNLSYLDRWIEFEKRFCSKMGYSELGQSLAQALDRGQLCSQLPPTPLKLYFPDTAVFLERMKAILEPRAGGYVLSTDALKRDPNTSEIWLATQLLFRCAPQLEELPPSIADSVANLPTEKLRKDIENLTTHTK